MDQLKEFEFNLSKARQSIIIFIASSLFLTLLIIITENKLSSTFSEFKEIYVFVFLVYCGYIILLCIRFYHSFSRTPKICINTTEMIVPTYYLGEKRIEKSEIYSVEELLLNNKVIGASLGIRKKGSYVIDKYRFKNPDEFQQFYDYLYQLIVETVGIEKNKVFDAVKAKQKIHSTTFSYVVCAIAIIFYFIGTRGGIEYSDNIDFLLIGANTKATISSFEIYRIFSSTFLHISIFHLLLNLLMLGIFSQFMERSLAYVRFSNLFLLSSTIAVLMSAWLSDFDASIGASGGIFGLWGAYTVLKIRYEDCLPGSINSIPTKRFYYVLLVEIIIEVFLVDNVDFINHLGGFLAGFAYLYFAPLGPKLETVDQPTQPEKYLFALLVSSYTLGLAYFLLLYYGLI